MLWSSSPTAQTFLCSPAQQFHQLVLGAVGVLVLVDQNVAEAPLVALAGGRGHLEQAHGFEQQVVEVHGVVLAQLGFVRLVDVGDALAVGVARAEIVVLRVHHVVLGPRDAAQHGARGQLLDVQPHAAHDLLHQAGLVVLVEDGERARQALVVDLQGLDVAPQDAHAEGVERGDQRLGDAWRGPAGVHALAHLRGGLVGEGDGQDGVRGHALLLDQPGDAAGDHPCLARARAREDEQGALRSLDGGALFWIQFGDERLRHERRPAGRVLLQFTRRATRRGVCRPHPGYALIPRDLVRVISVTPTANKCGYAFSITAFI